MAEEKIHGEEVKMAGQPQDTAYRMSGKGAMQEEISKLRRRANGLERLHNAIPDEISEEADQALWGLICFRN